MKGRMSDFFDFYTKVMKRTHTPTKTLSRNRLFFIRLCNPTENPDERKRSTFSQGSP